LVELSRHACVMYDQPPFVREFMEWVITMPIADLPLVERSTEHSAIVILSTNGRELLVHLHAINGPSSSPPYTERPARDEARRVTLWEDLWWTKQSIVKSRIAAQLGISERIPARLTRVGRLDRPMTLAFLQENHLQDAVLSKFRYGLFLPKKHYRVLKNPPDTDELLVAVGTFAHPRLFLREGLVHRSFELVRFANLLNSTVVGGLDKVVSHFIKQHQPDDLMTYADLDWSDGNSYRTLGFEPISDTPPQLFWIDPGTSQRYLPHRLPGSLSEQSALEEGFVAIYNAGSRKFVKVLTSTT
jgi:hypothetical protein